jgi:hypothetical protein
MNFCSRVGSPEFFEDGDVTWDLDNNDRYSLMITNDPVCLDELLARCGICRCSQRPATKHEAGPKKLLSSCNYLHDAGSRVLFDRGAGQEIVNPRRMFVRYRKGFQAETASVRGINPRNELTR